MPERRWMNVGNIIREPNDRDEFHWLSGAARDSFSGIHADTEGVAVGEEGSYSLLLTEGEAEQILARARSGRITNLRYLEPDPENSVGGVGEVRLAETTAPRLVPEVASREYMKCDGLEEGGWDGSGLVGAVLDGGTSDKLRKLFGWDIVDEYDFVGGHERRGHRNEHGCYVAPHFIPRGAALQDYIVFDEQGRGFASNTAKAGHRAIDRGAAVINFSGSGPSPSRVYEDLLDRCEREGVVFTCSAGNSGEHGMGYPAAYSEDYDCVFSSIANDKERDRRAGFSQYGAHASGCAPGVQELSYDADARLIRWNGTSASSPNQGRLVTMGATKGARSGGGEDYAPMQIKRALEDNARELSVDKRYQGNGVLELRFALEALGAFDKPEPEPEPDPPKDDPRPEPPEDKPEPDPTPEPLTPGAGELVVTAFAEDDAGIEGTIEVDGAVHPFGGDDFAQRKVKVRLSSEGGSTVVIRASRDTEGEIELEAEGKHKRTSKSYRGGADQVVELVWDNTPVSPEPPDKKRLSLFERLRRRFDKLFGGS